MKDPGFVAVILVLCLFLTAIIGSLAVRERKEGACERVLVLCVESGHKPSECVEMSKSVCQ